MTRIPNRNYDTHQTITVYTFANESSSYWPTNNCSRPLHRSTATRYITNLVNKSFNQAQVVSIDAFEIVHLGDADVRVGVDDVEFRDDSKQFANESMGKLLSPGEVWAPPFRLKHHLTFFTSSNISQKLQLSIAGYGGR